MSNIVFVLGAGASADAGAPLMANFLDVAQNLLTTGQLQHEKADFELVFKTIGLLHRVYSKSNLRLTNIEDVFAAFEMGELLGKLPGFASTETSKPVIALRNLIVRTLEKQLLFPIEESPPSARTYIGAPRPYREFVELVQRLQDNRQNEVGVITFNYDLALDVAFTRYQVGFGYHLEQDDGSLSLPLLKLHGSLNWGTCNKCKVIGALPIAKYFSDRGRTVPKGNRPPGVDLVELPIGSDLDRHFHCEGKFQSGPFLVPPTWNKSSGHENLRRVWAKAASLLSEADELYVCGYSFPASDAFFQYLYALGSQGDKPFRRIRIIDPGWGIEMKARFAGLFGEGARPRFRPLQYDFAGAIGNWAHVVNDAPRFEW